MLMNPVIWSDQFPLKRGGVKGSGEWWSQKGGMRSGEGSASGKEKWIGDGEWSEEEGW